jgi:hypothetical protein
MTPRGLEIRRSVLVRAIASIGMGNYQSLEEI